MLHSKYQGALTLLCSTMLAGSLLLSGCGKVLSNTPEPTESPAAEEPAPGDDGGDGGDDGGGGYEPAPAPGGGGSTGGGGAEPAPAPSKPSGKSTLRPLPVATPTPGPKAPSGGGGPDPAVAMDKFVDLLRNFGYEPANSANAAYNVRMQMLPLTRVPSDRFHFTPSNTLNLTYGRRKAEMAKAGVKVPATIKEWMDGGLDLARRDSNVSWYVGRRELYRDIFRDRYTDDPDGSELIFYKRLVKTGWVVSYRANGQVDDYAFVPEFTWREYLAVPNAFLQ